jgi:xylose isomerase
MLGWDTDQFPNNLPQVALALYHILQGGGFTSGGLNFDAKLRRQSIDPDDLIAGHAGAMDLCARALLVAEKMIEDGALAAQLEERYAGWNGKLGKSILAGKQSLDSLARLVAATDLEPQPRSGRQERLEQLVGNYV